jgi:hypothetical protein
LKTDGKNMKVPAYPVCQLDSEENILTFKFKIPEKFTNSLLSRLLLSRKTRFGYAFRRIPLTQGKYAIVDPEDYEKLIQYKWHAKKGLRTYYANHSLITGKKGKRKSLYMHHLVIDVPANMYCDHINHNGLDNRKANLRAATSAQNIWNRRKFKKANSISKYTGVYKTVSNTWYARITVLGKLIYLGTFKTEVAAAKAYAAAARKYHGQFASINFKDLTV